MQEKIQIVCKGKDLDWLWVSQQHRHRPTVTSISWGKTCFNLDFQSGPSQLLISHEGKISYTESLSLSPVCSLFLPPPLPSPSNRTISSSFSIFQSLRPVSQKGRRLLLGHHKSSKAVGLRCAGNFVKWFQCIISFNLSICFMNGHP